MLELADAGDLSRMIKVCLASLVVLLRVTLQSFCLVKSCFNLKCRVKELEECPVIQTLHHSCV